MDEINKYQRISVYTHNQPDHITPGELSSLLTHIGNMYPQQFIVELSHHYDKDSNVTLVEIVTTGEKFPGQFDTGRKS